MRTAQQFASPGEAVAALRSFHEATGRFEGRLRDFDPRHEAMTIAELVNAEAGSVIRDAPVRFEVPRATRQPLHGDAHFENVLASGVWQDFDEVCAGPREWDLAS